VGYLPERLVTAQPVLSGSRPSRPADVAMEAGELLRDLQAAWAPDLPPAQQFHQLAAAEVSARLFAAKLPALRGRVEPGEPLHDLDAASKAGVPAAQPFQQLAAAETSARLVQAILPPLGERVEALLRELETDMPAIDRLVPAHGDFNARQLLVQRDGLALVDFDGMCLAPAALDPAKYAAYLVLGGPNDLHEASEVLDELLEGYGDRPFGLSWYLATCILRRAPRPFRYLDEHWPERVEGMIAASEAALRS
jgi:hypothetical protein